MPRRTQKLCGRAGTILLPRRRGQIQLMHTPIYRRRRGRTPVFRRFGQGPTEAPLDLLRKSGRTTRQDQKVVALKRHTEEAHRTPKHACGSL